MTSAQVLHYACPLKLYSVKHTPYRLPTVFRLLPLLSSACRAHAAHPFEVRVNHEAVDRVKVFKYEPVRLRLQPSTTLFGWLHCVVQKLFTRGG